MKVWGTARKGVPLPSKKVRAVANDVGSACVRMVSGLGVRA